jgi:hypothetical protein
MSGRDQVVNELAVESLRIAGRLRFRAQGASMIPAIMPGTEVEIERRDAVAAGDIVLTRTPAGLRLHRLIEIRGEQFVTRGDNHRHEDPPISAENVLGTMRPRPSRPARWFRWRRA